MQARVNPAEYLLLQYKKAQGVSIVALLGYIIVLCYVGLYHNLVCCAVYLYKIYAL